jgi:hypothetical protein
VAITHHRNIPSNIPSHTQPEKMGMSQYERHDIPNTVALVLQKRCGGEFLFWRIYTGIFGSGLRRDAQISSLRGETDGLQEKEN